MIAALCVIASLVTIMSVLTDDTPKLIYAFEFARHGARAPMVDTPNDGFPEAAGMLTP